MSNDDDDTADHGGVNHAPVNGGATDSNPQTAQPTFIDTSGNTISIGDRVDVLWPTEGTIFPGTVTEIDTSDSTYHVDYDDGDSDDSATTTV